VKAPSTPAARMTGNARRTTDIPLSAVSVGPHLLGHLESIDLPGDRG
jgi:hypothetical protein